MKKFLFILLSCIFALNAGAQENLHLDFKGVPIDGNVRSFVEKMKNKGFGNEIILDNGITVLEGTFVGKSATVFVVSTPETNTVWKVAAIIFKDDDLSWSSLKSYYKDFVELYEKKYGKPSSHFEFFTDPYYEGDGYELQALRRDKCTYQTFFETEVGLVSIEITKKGSICFSYEDEINVEKKRKEADRRNLDDI